MTPPAGSRVLVSIRIAAEPPRVFEAFTGEIDQWWQHNSLFRLSRGRPGTLSFVPGPTGRLVEVKPDGREFVVGEVRTWDPPHCLVLSWREEVFDDDQETELHVRFEAVDGGTRVTVEHYGWDGIPVGHAARHGFELTLFQRRFAEWLTALLAGLRAVAEN